MYKGQKQLKKAISICLISFILFSCNNGYKGKLEVIKYHISNNKWPCYLKKEVDKYLVIDFKRRYKDGVLIEYEGCASEGKYIEDFTKDISYSKEDELVKVLSIQRTENTVIYFDNRYSIVKQTNDSIFVNTKIKNEYYVFVGKIPFKQ